MDTDADRLIQEIEDISGDDELSLTCPACGADLVSLLSASDDDAPGAIARDVR